MEIETESIRVLLVYIDFVDMFLRQGKIEQG